MEHQDAEPPKEAVGLLKMWAGPHDFVNALNAANPGEKPYYRQLIDNWRRANAIPAKHFNAVIRAAEYSGVPGVTFETLHKMMEKSKND